MEAVFLAAEGVAAPSAAQVAELKALLRAEGPALPSRSLARYNARLANIERRAAPPPAAFNFAPSPASAAPTVSPPPTPAPVVSPASSVHLDARAGVEEVRGLVGQSVQLEQPTKHTAIHLHDLKRCRISIPFPVASLSMSSLSDCVVIAPLVHGSVFADASVSCRLVLGAAQIRMRGVRASVIAARAQCAPLLESCHDVGLAPWPLAPSVAVPPPAAAAASPAATPDARREWCVAEDMSWPRAEASPNWRAVSAIEL